MAWLLPFFILFTAFLFFYAIFSRLLLTDKRMAKRRAVFLKVNDAKKLDRRSFNVLVELQLYKQTVKQKLMSKQKNERLTVQLSRAGVALKPEEFVMFQWIATALCGGLLYLLSDRVFFLLLGAMLGFVFPRWWIRRKESMQIVKFNEQLPDMITTVIGSLRAGFSFAQSLKAVTEESESPMREEIELVLREMQYGIAFEDALLKLKERMPSDDLELMIQAILIQKQVGGNLATVLETIVQTIRDRGRIARQIRTLTAQGRLSGMVIGALPLVVGVLIYFIEPEYMAKFFTHPIGMAMIGAGAVSGTIGFVLIRKLTRVEI